MKINLEFPDGSKKQFEAGISGYDIAVSISEGLARNAICINVNEKLMDLLTPINQDSKIQIITFKDDEGVEVFRHSTAHVLAHAIQRLYPEAKNTIGPAVERGFYYDFDNLDVKEDDLEKIELEMKNIIKEELVPKRIILSEDEALKKFKDNSFKIEMIKEFASKGEELSVYQQGDFIDLCLGPHVPNTKMLKAVKLTKLAGAYWKGDSNNKQLVRIYGISFPDKKLLKTWVKTQEEALKRDHNKLGRELKLFITSPLVGQGLPLFTPKGTRMIKTLQRWIEDLEESKGYLQTITPYMAKSDLYKVSGHWDHYKDGMFLIDGSGEEMALRPMTCPYQFLIYNSQKRSYKDLPIKYNETSTLFRNESSGEMHGLIRVRQFTISEAHLICKMDQIKKEFKEVVSLIEHILQTLGLSDYWFRFSKGDRSNKEKYIDNPEAWDESENALKEILDEIGKEYETAEGEAAFYGPKLDIQMKNVYGKPDTIITVQIDFALPERFNMLYTDKDNTEKHPIIIHRTSIGCYERTLAMLIEKYAGKFPLWLSPNQVKILPIADRHNDFAKEVEAKLKSANIYVEVDDKGESIKKKVRNAQIELWNYSVVIGDKELENKTITVRSRNNEILGEKTIDEFIKELREEIDNKVIPEVESDKD